MDSPRVLVIKVFGINRFFEASLSGCLSGGSNGYSYMMLLGGRGFIPAPLTLVTLQSVSPKAKSKSPAQPERRVHDVDT